MTWLCWLRLHLWHYVPVTIADVTVVNRECVRCHREQIYAAGAREWITVKP